MCIRDRFLHCLPRGNEVSDDVFLQVRVDDRKLQLEYDKKLFLSAISNNNFSLPLDFLDSEFTLTELRNVYEQIWNTKLHASNFERKVTSINNFITKTSNTKLTGNNRPGTLYKKGTEKNILILRNN
mgnify:CR=1 FL=1